MGLFDFLRRDKFVRPDDGKPVDRKLASLGKTAADKRAQAYDRDEAIRGLIAMGTADAAEALLKRFKLNVDPSITDQEEKQLAFDGIVSIGRGERGKRLGDSGKDTKDRPSEPLSKTDVEALRDAVVASTREYCQRAENLTWALKVLRELLDDAAYEKELVALLDNFDTEYTRNVEPKVNLLAALEGVHSDAIRQAAERYLDDVNETVRFHAVETVYKQADQVSIAPLVAMLQDEESVRIKNKVAEGMLRLRWKAPAALLEDLKRGMTDAHEYRVAADGGIHKAR